MRDTNGPGPEIAGAFRFAESLDAEGRWADIDYSARARSGWPPASHYTRMASMVAAANRNAGLAHGDRDLLLTAVHRAFRYWIAHDYQCPNWWYNEIGTPKTIGLCAILLGDQLTDDEYRYVTEKVLARYGIGRTGQNKVWLAGNALMLGIVKGDEALIAQAANAIWSEIVISTEEGIQPDFSFHQHGAQQQFGNYGMAFAVEVCRWGTILRGTSWKMPEEKLGIFRGYLLEGQNWVSWCGAMDISACGRQFMPRSPISKTANIARVMEEVGVFDPAHATAYAAYIARNKPGAPNDLIGNHYFWRSDYMIHRTASFSATLKMSSKRVIGAELVNSENKSGFHIGDGALYLYRTGDEYTDIFPVWDWRKLPGVTCAQVEPAEYKTSSVPTEFVGGVSDGKNGIAILDYAREGVRAKKSWFFVGDQVVCLGADINGDSPEGIATTLNQCLYRGQAWVQQGGNETDFTGLKNADDVQIEAVEHDGWRYDLLESAVVRINAGPVTGNWKKVFDNPETPKKDVTQNVFTAWIDHGKSAKDATYAYAVHPVGTGLTAKLVENSSSLQVVKFDPDVVGIAFWSPARVQLSTDATLEADQPCVVLINLTSGTASLTDPTQKLDKITLTLNENVTVVELPQHGDTGRTVKVSLKHR